MIQEVQEAIDLISDAGRWDFNVELLERCEFTVKTRDYKNPRNLWPKSTTTWSDKSIYLAENFLTAEWTSLERAGLLLHESVHIMQYRNLGGFKYYWKMAIEKQRWILETEAFLQRLLFRVVSGERIRDLDGTVRRFLDSHSISQYYFFKTYVKAQAVVRR